MQKTKRQVKHWKEDSKRKTKVLQVRVTTEDYERLRSLVEPGSHIAKLIREKIVSLKK